MLHKFTEEYFKEDIRTITTKNLGELKLKSKCMMYSGRLRMHFFIKCPICGDEKWIASNVLKKRKTLNCIHCSARINSENVKEFYFKRFDKHPDWLGGAINDSGYIVWSIYPDNPYYETAGKYTVGKYGQRRIRLSRYIMAQHLGRNLRQDEHVHHKDKNKLNNSIENLEIITPVEHGKMHRKEQIEKEKLKKQVLKERELLNA